MQSKADTSQLNLRTAPATKKVDRQKILKVKKTDVLRSIGKQSGESVDVRTAAVGRTCRKKRRF